ncbi:MAG: hypothetical protein ABGX16_21410 [Pirellulales bacterium]
MKSLLHGFLIICAGFLLLNLPTAAAETYPPAINPGTPWPATDALGRTLPTTATVGPPRQNRFVGIFYFLWHNQHGGKSPNWDGPYDVAKILTTDPHALKKPDSPLWGPIGMYHYWSEPLYGYYRSEDPWVLRRHAQMLADAGVDMLIFDTTNAVTYPQAYRKLCAVFQEIRAAGGRTPKIAFMVNTQAGKTAARIYHDLYHPGLFRGLWFVWQGKPLMICDPQDASGELRSFFTLRRAHWPFTQVNTENAWHWEATYPQAYGYTDDPKRPEQVNVSVAQNLRQSDGEVTNMSSGTARGRSFHEGQFDHQSGAVNHGHNFQEQWQRVSELDPPFVMVTGWNEWIAGRWGKTDGPITFVDQLDQEFSRDIEPMRGGHGDNYYWQLVANVRRYKGAPALPSSSPALTIDLDGPFEQWREVQPEYLDSQGDTTARDFDGAAGLHYVNRSGRNDLVAMKVARDEGHVYWYARTRKPLSPHTDGNWMWLLIEADQNTRNGWHGYDYIVNRTVENAKSTWLERCVGGWHWEKVARIRYRTDGDQLHLQIPRAALRLAGDNTTHAAETLSLEPFSLGFQWIDNSQHPGDIMDVYRSGDVAPEGRFRYQYLAE